MTKIQNSNLDQILKSLNSRHSGESRGPEAFKLLDSAKASLRARLSPE